MPGLSFICDLERGIDGLVPQAHRALEAIRHDRTYGNASLFHDTAYLLAVSAYPEYPVAAFEFGDVTLVLEGRIYDPNSPELTLRRLAQVLFEPGASARQVADWVREIDGEFVIVATHPSTGRVTILNDLLGRLPLYAHRRAGALLVSREVGFIAPLLPSLRFDRMGMAQFLLFGFPLGRRTLLEGVERVPPATCIRIDPRRAVIDVTGAAVLDLSPTDEGTRSRGEVEHELATLFATACRTRAAAAGANVVSLSGGADSRSVAACLRRLDVPFQCATFLDSAAAAAADLAVAERLATLFGSPWHLFRLPPPSGADQLNLLRRKSGLNPLSMSYLLPYLEQAAQHFGSGIVFFTGDGGDKLLPDLRPAAPVADSDDAVAEVLRARQILSPDWVGALTGVSCADLCAELRDRLDSYPEERWADRYVHFELFERAFKWLFEGEDRNRGYFWSTTPFYSTPFFLGAMRLGGNAKAHRALYRDFLHEISPAAAAVEYAGVGAPIDSAAFRVAAKAASLLAAHASRGPAALAGHGVHAGAASAALDALRRQVAGSEAVAAHLHVDRLAAFLDGPAATLPHAVDALFTLTSVIETFAGGEARLPVALTAGS